MATLESNITTLKGTKSRRSPIVMIKPNDGDSRLRSSGSQTKNIGDTSEKLEVLNYD
jgi:hypothetical protein